MSDACRNCGAELYAGSSAICDDCKVDEAYQQGRRSGLEEAAALLEERAKIHVYSEQLVLGFYADKVRQLKGTP